MAEAQPSKSYSKQNQQLVVEEEQQQEESKEEEMKMMKPWEQHSGIISIPRFDYNAPSSLLHHSHTGFLITSPIKREKSATKEAISILEKCIESHGLNCLEESAGSENVKRRKLCQLDGESAISTSSERSNDESPSTEKTGNSLNHFTGLLLVKVTRSGLVLFTFPKGSTLDPVGIVSYLTQSIESGTLKRPLWCHRVFPIQATCRLNEDEVSAKVLHLVRKYVDDKGSTLPKPLKFAVGYNRRGIEDTEMKGVDQNSSDPKLSVFLDRNKCFSVVAAAVKEAVSDSVVDLKSPELCILIEVLPLSGLPKGSLVTAVSVLPRDLVSIKPRLCVKALVSDAKPKKQVS